MRRIYTFAFGPLALDVSADSAAEAVEHLREDLSVGYMEAYLNSLSSVTDARIELKPAEVTEACIVNIYPPEDEA